MSVLLTSAPSVRAPGPARTPARPRPGVYAVVGGMGALIVAWYVILLYARPAFFVDEGLHIPTIRGLARGDWDYAHRLPMFPTYHLLVAALTPVIGSSVWALRGVNTLVSLFTIWVLHRVARARNPDYGPGHFLCLALQPLLLPLYAVVYTDVPSLLTLLLALAAWLRGRHLLVGAALLAAIALRQSNLVWAAFFGALTLQQLRPQLRLPGAPPARGRAALRVLWPYGVVLAVGAAFLLWNGPLAHFVIHNKPEFNLAQYYDLALFAALFWLPIWLPHLWAMRAQAARWLLRPTRPAGLLAAIGCVALAFHSYHEWNQCPDFVRNWPLLAMTWHGGTRFLFAAAIVVPGLALAHLTRQRANRELLGLIWVFTLIFLLPHYLVDPRYYVVTFVLVDLFTPYRPSELRRLCGWYLVLTLFMATYIVVQPSGYIGFW